MNSPEISPKVSLRPATLRPALQLAIDVAHAGVLTIAFYLALQVVALQLISSGI